MGKPSENNPFAPNEILVRFRKHTKIDLIMDCVKNKDSTIELQIESLAVFRIMVPDGQVLETIEQLYTCDDILYAEPNYFIQTADTIPNDSDMG